MKTAIGIDIGGTKISLTLGNEKGVILSRIVIPTQTGKKTAACVQELIQSVLSLIKESGIPKSKITGIGVGIPGAVQSKTGKVPCSPNLPGWEGFPLKQKLEKAVGRPVMLANDANAAALGEKKFGNHHADNFIYVTVSTGIGGGIIVNGKLVEGAGGAGGEVGHMKVAANGELCKCGMKGCLEAYASGTAIAAYAVKQIKAGKKSLAVKIAAGRPMSTRYLGPAAKQKDPFAVHVYERAGFYLGVGLANLLNILNPQKVVFGGGVFESAPALFWKAMMRSAEENAWPQAFDSVKITLSKRLGYSGDYGALAVAFESFK